MKSYEQSKGPGATTLEVYDRDGKVVIAFPNEIRWAALDPQTAVAIAEKIVEVAKACGYARPIILLPRH